MQPSETAHIFLDDRGRPWIDDTNVKVIQIVRDSIGNKWTPEAIHIQYPHLSLAQIHAALAYYYDHQAEMDAEIERVDRDVEALRAQAGESPVRKKLQDLGLIP